MSLRIPGVWRAKRALQNARMRSFVWRYFRPLLYLCRFDVGGIPLWLNPRDAVVSRKCFIRGWWEPLEAERIAASCRPGAVCIDIGANVGFYACLMSRQVGPGGKVYAFEPSAENFGYLRRNAATRPNIVAENKALSDCTGEVALFLSERHKGDHRLYQPATEPCRRTCTVPCTTIESYLREHDVRLSDISVIKMDTQGTEPKIIRSMAGILADLSVATVFAEFWPQACEDQSDIDGAEYLAFLAQRFFISDLNYNLSTFNEVRDLDALKALYDRYLRAEDGVDHSTLVLRAK